MSDPESPNLGFIKLMRGEATDHVLRDPKAFTLLALIATRARYSPGRGPNGMEFGQARIGDFRAVGLTGKEYRCALARLVKWGYVTTQPSRRGTVATMTDSRVWSLRNGREFSPDQSETAKWGERKSEQKGESSPEGNPRNGANTDDLSGANEGRTEGERGASNQKGKKERKAESSNPPGAEEGLALDDTTECGPSHRDLFAALTKACGVPETSRMTKPEATRTAKALALIRAVEPALRPETLAAAASAYRRRYREAALTPMALANHWGECCPPPAQNPAGDTEPEGWWEALLEHRPDALILNEPRRAWSAMPRFVKESIREALTAIARETGSSA